VGKRTRGRYLFGGGDGLGGDGGVSTRQNKHLVISNASRPTRGGGVRKGPRDFRGGVGGGARALTTKKKRKRVLDGAGGGAGGGVKGILGGGGGGGGGGVGGLRGGWGCFGVIKVDTKKKE